MRDNFTGKSLTMSSVRKGLYPMPVVEVRYLDGSVERMTFWAPGKAGHAELRARADHFALTMQRNHGKPAIRYTYLEHNGQRVSAEPLKTAKRTRVTKADWQAVLRQLLEVSNGSTPPELERKAQELLAA